MELTAVVSFMAGSKQSGLEREGNQVQPGPDAPRPPTPPGFSNVPVPVAPTKHDNHLDTDTQEMLSFWWILRGFFMDCTAHGFPKIINSGQFERKIFWLASTLIMLLLFILQMAFLFYDYSTYPISMNIQVVSLTQIRFPLVTICNSNKLRKSEVEKLDHSDELYKIIKFEKFNAVALTNLQKQLVNDSGSSDVYRDTYNTSCQRIRETPVLVAPIEDYEYSQERERRSWWGGYDYYYYYYSGGDSGGDDSGGTTSSVSTGNEFPCDDGEECVPDNYVCDGYDDCDDGSDESESTCTSCTNDEFVCRDGSCIDGWLRCDGQFDCEDGSDEEEDYCSEEYYDPDYFVCCNRNLKIPVEYACDGLEDCHLDRSDEYLSACEGAYNNSGSTDWLMCPRLSGNSRYTESVDWIASPKVGDSEQNCAQWLDEVCAWKLRRDEWTSPLASRDYDEYLEFMDLVKNNPDKTRWYQMATEQEILSLGHDSVSIISCVFNNNPCYSDHNNIVLHTSVNQEYGRCLTYEALDPISSVGPKYGLNVLINLEAYDYLGLLTPTSAIKLFLTPPGMGTTPDGSVYVDYSTEMSLPPGSEHRIKLHSVLHERLPDPFSECSEYGEGSLKYFKTKGDCEMSCLNDLKYAECGCADDVAYTLIHENTSLCTLNQTEARNCVDNLLTEFEAVDSCSCPDQCTTRIYETLITSANWPTNTSLVNFFTTIADSMSDNPGKDFTLNMMDKYTDDKKYGTNSAVYIARTSFLKVNVHMGDMSETEMKERPFYTFVALFSNVGGLLGLYLGLSALSILELVDFAFDLYDIFTIKGKQKRLQRIKQREEREKKENERKEREWEEKKARKKEEMLRTKSSQSLLENKIRMVFTGKAQQIREKLQIEKRNNEVTRIEKITQDIMDIE